MGIDEITAGWFNTLPEDQRIAALSGGLGNAVMYAGLQFALPFWWVTAKGCPQSAMTSGASAAARS
jgi:hypothetical protein